MPKVWLPRCSALAFSVFFPWFPIMPPVVPEAEQTVVVAPAPEEPVVLLGVVIEEIPEGSALKRAGLQVGDVILSWERLPNPPANPEGARGELSSYFDWLELEVEQVPRGVVMLRGRRGGESLEIRVEPGLWVATVRPVLAPAPEEIYLAGKAKLALGDVEAAVGVWRSIGNGAVGKGGGDLWAWVVLRIAKEWGDKGSWDRAVEACQKALGLAGSALSRSAVWESLGNIYEKKNNYEAAEEAYDSALQIRQRISSESLGLASSINKLGLLASSRGDLDYAYKHLLKALQIREKLAPQSLQVASSLNNLGLAAFDRGQLDVAHNYHLRALQIREQIAPESLEVAASLNNLGIEARARGEFQLADGYHRRALQIREGQAPLSMVLGQSLTNLGELAWARGEFDNAHDYLVRAQQIYEQLAPDSVDIAHALLNLGKVSISRSELELAEEYLLQALRIFQKVAPKSLNVAHGLNNMGALAWTRGELDQAYGYFHQALRVREQLAPDSLDIATDLNNLGVVARARGDLSLAYDNFIRALRIRANQDPQGLGVAASLTSLGNLAADRGDLDTAYDYHGRALKVYEKTSPNELDVAIGLMNLGRVALDRKEWDRAHEYFLRALRIEEKFAPRSLRIAASLNNLGVVARDRGELDQAYNYHSRALQLKEQLAPGSLDVAYSLNNLGLVNQDRGKLNKAKDLFDRALRILEKNAPKAVEMAMTLTNLGVIAMERNELPSAHYYHLRALQILKQLAPNSLPLATSFNHMGDVSKVREEVGRAHEYYNSALAALEHQISRLGGSYNVQASFRGQYDVYYHNALDLLLTQSRFAEAFHILERFRAQTFLAMLAERDTAFTADIPEELDRERRRLGVQYDRTLKMLAGLNPRDNAEEIEATRREIQSLDDESGDIEARIRQASPRLAELQYPKSLTAEGAQHALDSGTLLLSYSVGKEKTALFVLARSGDLEVKILPLGEAALRSQIKQLLSLIPEAAQGSSLGVVRQSRFQAASRELYTALLGPVAERIAASERLLILPDGPLHALPFGALVRDDGQYLAEWKPLHVALSATVFAELKQRRRPGGGDAAPIQLAAFGDPVYPQSLTKKTQGDDALHRDPVVRSAAERGIFDWQPLPYTRREVEGIARLFPAGTARTFVGPEALEERIKSLDPKTRILHLAAHGHTDEHLPSSSFVALTIPEDTDPGADDGPDRDNGLLQVWEIFEKVRLDADLVVLSACETALGEEQGGEGLIGLTRAFQYAGARTVMASLWSVQDQATSELMIRFYKHLRAGLPKDEALRQAQIELIRGPIEVVDAKGEKTLLDASSPYFWAGFQLYGDWQ